MKQIKILVATHKQFQMPADTELYLPLHVGREGKKDLGYTGDNTGDNISRLNPYYSELTGLYWAWKNLSCEYLGLVHYRRYFAKKRQSYREEIKIDDIILSQADIEKLLKEADVLVPKKRKYYIETLYSHYAHTHDAKHLELTREILAALYPDYLKTFDSVMKQRSGYMFNMFIMKKDLADAYCEWLFTLLDELYKRLDLTGYSSFDARLFGRVSERLFNVWLSQQGELAVKEVPFVYMEKINIFQKGSAFLAAKFLGKKYGKSF
ncbi:DUF4422 domain-containing protein [Streptococcus chenjunshii]|uniref:DUF4422 domain-containing protein n=1 Tax=Streptococcus chenjunshii TaxID=2173853 RepID=A0A372KPG0_9STRE|nr:DUF4422 domain-containing protein [Streptococcus chenjunshii]AXQ78533.1 DUF4422 domain-containing protein [Streptococcus chenjunshii]RFU52005.1 DUF4422 domain-containing protein [Streptococcus chenjunshii]RFU54197.1 DUF4422 domain-containing protein [Streptococcus chenjunshii]